MAKVLSIFYLELLNTFHYEDHSTYFLCLPTVQNGNRSSLEKSFYINFLNKRENIFLNSN